MKDKKINISGDLSSDEKFTEALQKIEKQGFIPTHRKGDTGIGKTLEDLLGIEENSVQASDIGSVELKASRDNGNSMVTLFTKSPQKRGVNNSVLRKKYGYKTEESTALNPDINVLHTTMNGRDFNKLDGKPFLKITIKDGRLYVEHAKDGMLDDVYWEPEVLKKSFVKKFPSQKLYHVHAESKIDENGVESFHFDRAYALQGVSSKKLLEAIENGDVEIDIRLGVYASGKNIGKPHDNGTAIRVTPQQLEDFFEEKKKLL